MPFGRDRIRVFWNICLSFLRRQSPVAWIKWGKDCFQRWRIYNTVRYRIQSKCVSICIFHIIGICVYIWICIYVCICIHTTDMPFIHSCFSPVEEFVTCYSFSLSDIIVDKTHSLKGFSFPWKLPFVYICGFIHTHIWQIHIHTQSCL